VAALLDPIAREIDRPAFESGDMLQLLQTTLNATALNVNAVLADLDAAAAEARRRAHVCDEYASAVQQYERGGQVGPYPRRPASWVDV
jgi:hypothetical protein